MMLAYIRLEGLRTLRDGGYLIMSLISPLVMYLVFSNLGVGGDDKHEVAMFGMITMAGFGAIGAVLTNGTGLAEDRALGWLRSLRLTPLRSLQVVTGRGITGMLLALPSLLAVLTAGALINGVSLGTGQWIAVVGLLWVGVAPMAVFGLASGYLFGAQIAQAIGAAGYMGLSILGGLWVPASKFPHWLQVISSWTPTNRYAELATNVAAGDPVSLAGIAILLGWFAAFSGVAVYAYRKGARR